MDTVTATAYIVPSDTDSEDYALEWSRPDFLDDGTWVKMNMGISPGLPATALASVVSDNIRTILAKTQSSKKLYGVVEIEIPTAVVQAMMPPE